MKKIHALFKSFLIRHYKLGAFSCSILMAIASISVVFSSLKFLPAMYFIGSTLCLMRLIVYKTGKIPFLWLDTTWDSLRLKYSGEELEQRYKDISIARATNYFMISLMGFFFWIICEVIMFLL